MEEIKHWQFHEQAAAFNSIPNFRPCLSSCLQVGHPSWKQSQATEGFNCRINCPALGAVLQHNFGGLDRQAQTQCFLLGCSRCWQPAWVTSSLLEEVKLNCCHLCYTDSIWEWEQERVSALLIFGCDDNIFPHCCENAIFIFLRKLVTEWFRLKLYFVWFQVQNLPIACSPGWLFQKLQHLNHEASKGPRLKSHIPCWASEEKANIVRIQTFIRQQWCSLLSGSLQSSWDCGNSILYCLPSTSSTELWVSLLWSLDQCLGVLSQGLWLWIIPDAHTCIWIIVLIYALMQFDFAVELQLLLRLLGAADSVQHGQLLYKTAVVSVLPLQSAEHRNLKVTWNATAGLVVPAFKDFIHPILST